MCFLSAWTDHPIQPGILEIPGAGAQEQADKLAKKQLPGSLLLLTCNQCLRVMVSHGLTWLKKMCRTVHWRKMWKVLEPPGICEKNHAYPPHEVFEVLAVLMFHENFPPKLTPSMSVVSDCPRPEVPTACQQPALWPSEEPGGTVGSRPGHLHNMSWSLKVDVCETWIQTRSSWMELHRTAASLSLALGGRHEIQNGKESWVKSWANQWTLCFSASLAFLRSWIDCLWFGEFWADCCLICLSLYM